MSRQVPFVWYELMTTDPDAAAAFYGAVIGWRFSGRDPNSAMDYRHITRSDGGGQGGVLPLTADVQAQGARPAWVPYLAVDDIDAALAALQADGARVLMGRMDIPEGSFAMVTDPQGAPFYVMKPVPPAASPDAQSHVFRRDGVQHARWNELSTSDPAGAKAFYAKHFGFAFNSAMPMGELGEYAFMDFDGQGVGAVMPLMDPARRPAWLTYFGVSSAVAAKAAIEAAGGMVMHGPHEVPGGEWIVVAADPQGAVFGVVGPKGE
ncbi:VOC family protein [Novosphingobium cyanobacteriorum]|uniref:VOC family protein n=1 Tax=Novosphingobium cyanobacteriorum TaxID=3024215 RepID=A0ABT6CJS7_9SPHN|nr:VOC family protein [Novosphingobium cyanobacteriorum]MDF8334180.1 VOC family protein [Novosphingobium cyanobacteriorum]